MKIIEQIQQILRKESGESNAQSTHKFVPGSVKVYGVKMPVLNELAKTFYKEFDLNLVQSLWNAGAFDEKMLAAKILRLLAKKNSLETLKLIESFSKDINNWAVCDTLGMQSPKAINKSHHKEIFALAQRLVKSKNLWQRRLALVIVEWYTRDQAFHPAIQSLIAKLEDDEEYYVKKAIEWINRNFEKKR